MLWFKRGDAVEKIRKGGGGGGGRGGAVCGMGSGNLEEFSASR